MGCGASAYQPLLPLPEPGEPVSFILQWGHGGWKNSSYIVLTKLKQKFLGIDGNAKSGFILHTLGKPRRNLGKCVIEEKALDVQRNSQYHGDSDKSDFSADELFNFKSSKQMMKLRWKSVKEATITNEGGSKAASLKYKLKGKSRACMEDADEYASQQAVNVETLPKKAYYKLQSGDGKLANFTTAHGAWYEYDRKWSCDNFAVSYHAIPGVDEVFLDSKAGDFAENLLLGFAIAYFMHPASNLEKLESQMSTEGRNKLGLI